MRTRGFEEVREDMKRTDGKVKLPQRMTEKACAYDFFANATYSVKPNEIVKIWTDVKSYMENDEALILNVRSSMGGRFMLANTQGWIDGDYYENESNDGNIGIFLKNISDKKQTIMQGDRIAQGMFIKYLTIDNDNVHTKRTGGFGSTN